LCLTVLFSLPALAQQSVAEVAAQSRAAGQALPADAPTRDQVLTFLDLVQVRKDMAAGLGNLKQIAKQGAEQSFRQKVPNPTPKQLDALNGIIDDMFAEMPLDEMMNAVISIYQRHLTKTDLEELIRFYSSPVGQKMISEQPQIMQESMRAGAAIQRKRMDEMMVKVNQRMQALAEASQDSNPTPKK
jgi:hypothetical protein